MDMKQVYTNGSVYPIFHISLDGGSRQNNQIRVYQADRCVSFAVQNAVQ